MMNLDGGERRVIQCAGGNVNYLLPLVGGRLLSCTSTGFIQRWNLRNGSEILPRCKHDGPVNRVVVAHGLILAACAGAGEPLGVWDEDTGEPIAALLGHDRPINHVAPIWAPYQGVVTASADKTLVAWDLTQPKRAVSYPLRGHTREVNCVQVHGEYALSCSADRQLILWDLASSVPVQRFHQHHGVVNGMAWPKRSLALSASNDRTVRVWNIVKNGDCIRTLEFGTIASRVGISDDLHRIVACGAHGRMAIWSPEWAKGGDEADWPCVGLFNAHDECITDLQVHGTKAITTAHDGTVRLWDLQTGSRLAVWKGHAPAISLCAAFTLDGTVVSGGTDGFIRVWDLPKPGAAVPDRLIATACLEFTQSPPPADALQCSSGSQVGGSVADCHRRGAESVPWSAITLPADEAEKVIKSDLSEETRKAIQDFALESGCDDTGLADIARLLVEFPTYNKAPSRLRATRVIYIAARLQSPVDDTSPGKLVRLALGTGYFKKLAEILECATVKPSSLERMVREAWKCEAVRRACGQPEMRERPATDKRAAKAFDLAQRTAQKEF